VPETPLVAVHTDPPPGNTLENERAELARAGATLETAAGDETLLTALLQKADAVINTVKPLTAQTIALLTRAQVIVRTGVGVDNVDLEAATGAGIVVACVPDASVEEVSNHALALILALSRKIALLDRALRAGRWDRSMLAPMGSISAQTLGLIGFGRIAQALGLKASALGLRIMAFDPYVEDRVIEGMGAVPASLDELLAGSDFISLHTPLTEQTRHLIGREQLGRMKSSAFVINTARGPLVDQAALVEALTNGTIAGAGLDVYETEPLPPGDPLLSLDSVVLTPHSAAFSDTSMKEIRRRAGEAAADVLMGYWPRGLVNPSVKPRRPLKIKPAG